MWRFVASISSRISSSKTSFRKQVAHRFDSSKLFATEMPSKVLGKRFNDKKLFIAFVLGGPGSGKGTQCAKIVETFGYTHLSAGDLLRREISSGSEDGDMILEIVKEGKIVPSRVTIKLIQKELISNENDKFLIDGFPRNEENRIAFERMVGIEPNLVLFFDCPEEEMVKRVLNRNEGRVDDNIDTIKKRLEVFAATTFPVIDYYSKKGKLHTINAVGTEDEIFERVRPLFVSCELKEYLQQASS